MKLLIITQKVDINDDVLGFMHGWIAEFAKNCKQVTVICLKKGEFHLPENVKILSLGKEEGESKIKYIKNFYKYIWRERRNYNYVWAHMNPEYILLGGLFWRAMGKKISLWYAHGKATWKLKMADKLVDLIFTSTKSGCRIKSRKIMVIGQGIDTHKFQVPSSKIQKNYKFQILNSKFKIITVGRISPSKDYETLIKAIELMSEDDVQLQVDIIGGAGLPKQEKYLQELKELVKNKNLENKINFVGPVANKDVVKFLQSADLFVNMSHTGSLDKAIAEAMSCGLPILTCNEALKEVLGKYQEMLMYNKGDYNMLAKKIKFIIGMDLNKKIKLGEDLRNVIKQNHSLENFIINILSRIQQVK